MIPGYAGKFLEVNLSNRPSKKRKSATTYSRTTSGVEVWPRKSYGIGWAKNGRD